MYRLNPLCWASADIPHLFSYTTRHFELIYWLYEVPEEVYGVAITFPFGVLTIAVILVIRHSPRL